MLKVKLIAFADGWKWSVRERGGSRTTWGGGLAGALGRQRCHSSGWEGLGGVWVWREVQELGFGCVNLRCLLDIQVELLSCQKST